MKPYYEHDGMTIYHGEMQEILPSLHLADLVLTDPPYGIDKAGMKPSTSSHGGRKAYEDLGWDDAPPTDDEVRLLLAAGRNQILWGANYYPAALPASMGWLLWDKGQRIDQADGELAFTSYQKALRVITLNRVELMKDGAVHPTQKPVKLMTFCLAYAQKHGTLKGIIDPYAGSFTSLVAAKLFGLKGIGIERQERFCEIGANRLAQGSLVFDGKPIRLLEPTRQRNMSFGDAS